jgi:hypothetical protein
MKYLLSGGVVALMFLLGFFILREQREVQHISCPHGALVARFDEYTFLLDIARSAREGFLGEKAFLQEKGCFLFLNVQTNKAFG